MTQNVNEQIADEKLIDMFAEQVFGHGAETVREKELKTEILRRMQSGWISVRDKLPEIHDYRKCADYLVTDGEEPGREAIFHRDGTWSWDNAKLELVDYEVMYWMPLPKLPREQING